MPKANREKLTVTPRTANGTAGTLVRRRPVPSAPPPLTVKTAFNTGFEDALNMVKTDPKCLLTGAFPGSLPFGRNSQHQSSRPDEDAEMQQIEAEESDDSSESEQAIDDSARPLGKFISHGASLQVALDRQMQGPLHTYPEYAAHPNPEWGPIAFGAPEASSETAPCVPGGSQPREGGVVHSYIMDPTRGGLDTGAGVEAPGILGTWSSLWGPTIPYPASSYFHPACAPHREVVHQDQRVSSSDSQPGIWHDSWCTFGGPSEDPGAHGPGQAGDTATASGTTICAGGSSGSGDQASLQEQSTTVTSVAAIETRQTVAATPLDASEASISSLNAWLIALAPQSDASAPAIEPNVSLSEDLLGINPTYLPSDVSLPDDLLNVLNDPDSLNAAIAALEAEAARLAAERAEAEREGQNLGDDQSSSSSCEQMWEGTSLGGYVETACTSPRGALPRSARDANAASASAAPHQRRRHEMNGEVEGDDELAEVTQDEATRKPPINWMEFEIQRLIPLSRLEFPPGVPVYWRWNPRVFVRTALEELTEQGVNAWQVTGIAVHPTEKPSCTNRGGFERPLVRFPAELARADILRAMGAMAAARARSVARRCVLLPASRRAPPRHPAGPGSGTGGRELQQKTARAVNR
ncbi:hypothetical protein AURDEDRAFT_177469 [Auricularia subglabra TFB-10046 SS5]|uniref:Uncharacterized protein n=1 Tax=Auricularia subglabra (strain TFB-10046 / SS5) TaxID=717982 RepID=J0LAM4_AURST|nr:hypothetical protein AURDEDRAFT_177469 [Auricularia subglabra TFB-10046 SS5]